MTGKSGIQTIRIKITSPLMKSEVEYACDLLRDNWAESVGLPYPQAYPGIDQKSGYLVIPMIKRVLENFVTRCDDIIDIAEDNLIMLTKGGKPRNPTVWESSQIAHYMAVIKVGKSLKRAVIAAAKRR